MESGRLHVVTGAFGYSGKYITRRLLDKGQKVRTLTNSPQRENPFGDRVEVAPYSFDNPEKLVDALKGVEVLINTYWVRFNSSDFAFSDAVKNSVVLFKAAKEAGVRRIVHTSITNPSEESTLEYFRGKALLERELIELGLSYAILRPAILFGKEDILINNIAWMLRHFPVFGMAGNGEYKLQPVYVDDFAQIAVRQAAVTENGIINAIGPETFTFRELVKTLGRIIGKPRPVISMPPILIQILGRTFGSFVGDTIITRDEIRGLMEGSLCVDAQPAGTTKLTEWAALNAETLGKKYASELARRLDRKSAY